MNNSQIQNRIIAWTDKSHSSESNWHCFQEQSLHIYLFFVFFFLSYSRRPMKPKAKLLQCSRSSFLTVSVTLSLVHTTLLSFGCLPLYRNLSRWPQSAFFSNRLLGVRQISVNFFVTENLDDCCLVLLWFSAANTIYQHMLVVYIRKERSHWHCLSYELKH